MFESLVKHMADAMAVDHRRVFPHNEEVPGWLSANK
jgi:hypothetical protein